MVDKISFDNCQRLSLLLFDCINTEKYMYKQMGNCNEIMN